MTQGILPVRRDDGPLCYLPGLNGILAAVVFLDGYVRHTALQTLWIPAIPGIIWIIVWIGRYWTNNIDIDTLEKLKYNVYTPRDSHRPNCNSIKEHK